MDGFLGGGVVVIVVVVVGDVVVDVGDVVVVVGIVVVVVVDVVVVVIAETVNVCATPVAAAYVVPAVTLAVSEHVPVARKVTSKPLTLQMLGEFVATETVPSPLVTTSALKVPVTCASVGMFEIVGVVGVNSATAGNSVTELFCSLVTHAVPPLIAIPSEFSKSYGAPVSVVSMAPVVLDNSSTATWVTTHNTDGSAYIA
jgi:hypothetical protein